MRHRITNSNARKADAPLVLLRAILITVFTLALLFCDTGTGAVPSRVNTDPDPIPVANAHDLMAVGSGQAQVFAEGTSHERSVTGGSNTMDAHYVLVKDIDLTALENAIAGLPEGNNFVPIGSPEEPFSGIFDGNGHQISNLMLKLPNRLDEDGVTTIRSRAGFFGSIGAEGLVQNVRLVNVDVKGGEYVGGLAASNSGTVKNSSITGSIEGGLVSEGASTSAASRSIGGLIGRNSGGGIVIGSSSHGNVSGNQHVGGLIGWANAHGRIVNSHSSARTFGGSRAGGLIGRNAADVISSYANGDVSGSSEIGGLAGIMTFGSITDSYSTGSATGSNRRVGGLLGHSSDNRVRVSNSYSTGRVEANGDNAGGLIGRFQGELSHSYWDADTSGKNASAAGVGKTTDELTSGQPGETVFNGWDPEIWVIEAGTYPWLRWQGQAGEHNLPSAPPNGQ